MRGIPQILVVDDDADVAAVVAEVLEGGGYEAATARDGEEALRLMDQQLPDLVLLDLVMPRMDGEAFLAACRERPDCAGLPIVLLTAWPAEADTWGAGGPQVRGALGKPFDMHELLAAVREAVGAVAI